MNFYTYYNFLASTNLGALGKENKALALDVLAGCWFIYWGVDTVIDISIFN